SRSVARGGPDMDVTHEGSEAILNGYCPRPVRVSSPTRTANPESVVLVFELPEDAGEGGSGRRVPGDVEVPTRCGISRSDHRTAGAHVSAVGTGFDVELRIGNREGRLVLAFRVFSLTAAGAHLVPAATLVSRRPGWDIAVVS